MVQQSKPWRANSFSTEYSPLPGTLRSNAREVTEEPCTKNTTGRDGSPVFGAPSRLRNIHRGTSPFLAQYSLLQMSDALSPAAAALCGAAASPTAPARRASPAALIRPRRGSSRSSMIVSSGMTIMIFARNAVLKRVSAALRMPALRSSALEVRLALFLEGLHALLEVLAVAH